ncbi:MAG TPA: hypothetical protein DCM68_06635 [Verrucomicrobia bacterium]|nr:hypothetical protein [Verrucomicrobiota bacterium]
MNTRWVVSCASISIFWPVPVPSSCRYITLPRTNEAAHGSKVGVPATICFQSRGFRKMKICERAGEVRS